MNPTKPPETAPRPGTVLGIAIKTDQVDNPTITEDQPDDAHDDNDNQTDDKNEKKENICHQRIRTKKKSKN